MNQKGLHPDSIKWTGIRKLEHFNGNLCHVTAISTQLRHANVTTMQRSYYTMERRVAGQQLKDAWWEHPIKMHDIPFIELKERLPGYG